VYEVTIADNPYRGRGSGRFVDPVLAAYHYQGADTADTGDEAARSRAATAPGYESKVARPSPRRESRPR
jgi:hypothetical protein